MKTYRLSFLSVAAFFMLLCSICIVSRSATACLTGAGGPTSFTAAPGGSQTLTWTASAASGSGGPITINVTAGSDVFTVSQMPVIVPSGGSATFTVTFTPGANATGTFKATLACPCSKTYELVGTVAASGVANSLPSNVSFTITPNPATDYVNILSSGVRTAEIGIYDLLGKKVASSKTTAWQWETSGIPAGSYMVRIVGESYRGEQFAILRRVIVAR